jgi:hypothetical protein
VDGKLGVLQVAIGQMIVDQLPDTVMGNQEIAPPEKAEQRPPIDREDVLAVQSPPDLREPQDAVERGIAGIIGAIPTLEPTTMSAVMPCLASDCIMPTCTAPNEPPPARTKAVRADLRGDSNESDLDESSNDTMKALPAASASRKMTRAVGSGL